MYLCMRRKTIAYAKSHMALGEHLSPSRGKNKIKYVENLNTVTLNGMCHLQKVRDILPVDVSTGNDNNNNNYKIHKSHTSHFKVHFQDRGSAIKTNEHSVDY